MPVEYSTAASVYFPQRRPLCRIPVPDDDRQAFDEAMAQVAPLGARSRAARPRHAPLRAPLRPAAAAAAVPPVETLPVHAPVGGTAVLAWRRPGLRHGDYQRLRAGRPPRPIAEHDLHGLRPEQAGAAIAAAIADSQRRGRRALCLIHGKGYRSGTSASRLKGLTAAVLRGHPEVLGFHSVPGNTGAVNVLLRRPAR